MPDASSPSSLTLLYGTSGPRPVRSWNDTGGVLRIGAGGVLAALSGAMPSAIAAWLHSGALFLIAAIIQGMIVGVFLKRNFVRNDLRSRSIAKVLAIFAGIFSVLLIQSFVYLRDVHDLATLLEHHGIAAVWLDMVEVGRLNPYSAMNYIAKRGTGHGGISGWFALRVKSAPSLPTLVLIQCTFTSFLSLRLSRSALEHPSCPSCGGWLRSPRNLTVIPATRGEALADAVRSDDVDRVVSTVHAASGEYLGRTCAIARKHHCKGCGSEWVDVVLKANTRSVNLLAPIAVSENMIAGLRVEAVVPLPVKEEPTEAMIQIQTSNSANSG